jgi:hypothetical protein
MENEYSKLDLEYMEDIITSYTSKNECNYGMQCVHCKDIEDCYNRASDRCNSEFAESVNYGGCNSETEFWEDLFG